LYGQPKNVGHLVVDQQRVLLYTCVFNAGVLLGEDTAFQAVGEGSNPFTRSIFEDTVMDVEQASFFLTSTILVMLGLIVITIGVTVINNIVHRYWKPVKIFTPDSWKGFYPPVRYTEQDAEPTLKSKK
jgi:hypothetical protein